jgi:hypothetical protein
MGARALLDKSNDFACIRARNDFLELVTGDLYSTLAADGGSSVAVGDAFGGVCVLTTGATNNNEAAVKTTKEIFKFADGKPAEGIARIQYAEANTDDANVMVGWMDAMAADAMVDDGAGPKASYSGAVIYKVDGETVWRCQTSNGTTKTTTVTQHTAGGSSYVTLCILVSPFNSTTCEVAFLWDPNGGTNFQQMLDVYGRPIKHTMLYASLTEMMFGVYAKAGGANSEVVNVDLLDPAQKR